MSASHSGGDVGWSTVGWLSAVGIAATIAEALLRVAQDPHLSPEPSPHASPQSPRRHSGHGWDAMHEGEMEAMRVVSKACASEEVLARRLRSHGALEAVAACVLPELQRRVPPCPLARTRKARWPAPCDSVPTPLVLQALL